MDLREEYHVWHSPSLGREFNMLVFGHGGYPVVLFPTSQGSYYQNKDQGLIETARWFLDNGKVKIYCPDSVDAQSWYNKEVSPAVRAYEHTRYDKLLLEELYPRMRQETGHDRVVAAGCSFGGYHAANFSFILPHIAGFCFSMSGVFVVRVFVDGYYEDIFFFFYPVDFIPGDQDP